MNNKIVIKVEAPLLRPGLSIETTVSGKYAQKGLEQMMGIVRNFNNGESPKTAKMNYAAPVLSKDEYIKPEL